LRPVRLDEEAAPIELWQQGRRVADAQRNAQVGVEPAQRRDGGDQPAD